MSVCMLCTAAALLTENPIHEGREYSAAPESATELLEAEEGLDSLTQSGLDTRGVVVTEL